MLGNSHLPNRTRLGLMLLVGVIVISLLLTACTGPQKKQMSTVGVMIEIVWLEPIFDLFKAAMAELGYIEGQNIQYIYHRDVERDLSAFEREAQSLKDQKVDMILTVGTLTTKAAKEAVEGANIPVLFIPVINPVEEGLVASIAQPGGNVTGVQVVDQSSKGLEWLTKLAPDAKKIYVPHNPADEVTMPTIKRLQETAVQLGLEFLPSEASSVDQMLAAVKALPQNTAIFIITPIPSLEPGVEALGKLAREQHIPLVATNRVIGEAPFPLANYGVSMSSEAKQGARMADRLFKGAKPATMPVESAEYYLSIDLKTAQELGLNLPDNILRQAETVIR